MLCIKVSQSSLCLASWKQDRGGLGIAISEEDTKSGVVVKSLSEDGAAGKVESVKGMKMTRLIA